MLAIDAETCSAADIKVCGAWCYAQHPSTRVLCVVLGLGDERWTWREGAAVPPVFRSAVQNGKALLAHNHTFEHCILSHVLGPRHGWPVPSLPQWEDTQAHAAAANLPVSLEGLAAALGSAAQKDTEGWLLMKKMSWIDADDGSNPNHTEENFDRLVAYCETDVDTTLDCWARVPKMTPGEYAIWRKDQEINFRGFAVDTALVERMQKMVAARKNSLAAEAMLLTDGELWNSTATPALKRWLRSKDVDLPMQKRIGVDGEEFQSESVGRQVVLELATSVETDPQVRAVLENRLEASKATSLAKLNKVPHLVSDGRIRNSLQFAAAHTGRWSSRGLQVHNFPRPKKAKDESEKALLSRLREAVFSGDLEALESMSRDDAAS